MTTEDLTMKIYNKLEYLVPERYKLDLEAECQELAEELMQDGGIIEEPEIEFA